MLIGTDWAREIEDQLRQSDYLIVLLSRDSVQSEMVRGEIEIARSCWRWMKSSACLP
jgi:hypothetical protein